MRVRTLLAAGLSLLLSTAFAQITPPQTFTAAKKLAWPLYAKQSVEFYCGCRYEGNRVDLASCGYRPRKNPTRAARIEWEHVVPAWVIGHQRQCWQKGGRDNCSRTDPAFRLAEADLHNLVPAIGEVNGDRSNYSFGWLEQKPYQYGNCPVVIDFKARKVMPRAQVRGMIARTYFYMHERYGMRMSRQERQLYEAWDRSYPVQTWELQRNQLIACNMGWGNPFVGPVDLTLCSTLLPKFN